MSKSNFATNGAPYSYKTRTSESRLVLVLHLIGWKSGASFLNQSRSVVNAKPITFRHSNENRSSCCCTLVAKIQSTFHERNQLFYGIQLWVFHFLCNVNVQAKSHFAIFQVLLFLRSTYCFQFLCSEYGIVWGITQCCSICILFAPSQR